MRNLSCWLILLLHLQFIVPEKNCKKSQPVFAAHGETVTLQVTVVEAKQIKQIFWVTSRGVHIATSQPNNPLEIREEFYEGRLIAFSDGSLIIKDPKMEDSGIIKATIYLLDGEDCSETYNLTVFGKCENLEVHVSTGRNVTLNVKELNIAKVMWEGPRGVIFATTKPGGYIDPQESRYNERLAGSHDGSLTILKVSAPDQGIYRAFVFTPDGVGCVCVYTVSLAEGRSSTSSSITVCVMTGIVCGLAALISIY
ncbi:hypothetical protein GDO81_014826 [Engystomops pustulosus]|uniref:Immunoglobulin domain-containing protein n=1 Tax=Engystomops pustulosus TaxID=76066 RepID=A0AAV7AJK7_ENGPU|nr:hypothetical protein GDO81_014826 [Engystomops pustulosus]KAG8560176.1 hypothetical protein GDO81_014826 [Engystomops pustulosus]KAG8560177.1 hypothetical protein GDO81_014826 [Engystomops pustulosus]KAG8560178.1 hypothetical protein GDO81_014826 [Engystomops pustulosus]KAG8560179.1 hypothetical protein GDO81_014826 [Engystomops pustulosus]